MESQTVKHCVDSGRVLEAAGTFDHDELGLLSLSGFKKHEIIESI